MDTHETRCSSQAIALAFLGGAIAGAVAGILLAPKSGEETRRELRGYARKAEEEGMRAGMEGYSPIAVAPLARAARRGVRRRREGPR